MDTNMSSNGDALINQEEPTSSIWGQIVGVFTAPSKAFEDYIKKPNIWVPLLICIAVVSVSAILTAEYESMIQYEIMKNSTVIPAEQIEQMRIDAQNPNAVKSGLFGMIFGILPPLLVGLIAWGIGSFIFGGKAKFKIIWGSTMMAGMIIMLGVILKIPLVIIKESALVSIGPAALFPDLGITSLAGIVMMYFDVFMIWAIVVMGLGFSKALGFTTGKGMATSIISNVGLIGCLITLQMVGMKFAGVETTWF
ncbi:MAG: YIP1 family protein [candidate division Zixibacteria bacterium]|nr:YIP1 family protein [candidate division Zixibacteria bacterium]